MFRNFWLPLAMGRNKMALAGHPRPWETRLFWQKRYAIEKKRRSSRFFGLLQVRPDHARSVSFLHIVSWSLCRRPCGSRAQLRALTFLTALVDSELERLVSLVELELLEDDGDGFDVGVPAEILFLSAN